MDTIGERLAHAIELQDSNPNKIAKGTNIHASTIKNYLDNNGKPDYLKLDAIADFLKVNRKWLRAGDGDLKDQVTDIDNDDITKAPKGKFERNNVQNQLVPFYNVDFAAGNQHVLVDNTRVKPDYYMDVPEFAGCTAFRAYSDSMERLIKSGSILFGTKIDEWNIHLEYGQIYGIICTDGRRYLKYIKKFREDPVNFLLFESENPNHDEFEMPKKFIRSIWLIHGWLNKRT